MVRRPDDAWPEDLDAEVPERLDPLLERLPNAEVALVPDAADLARAVVEIVVRGELVVLWLRLHGRWIGEVLAHVRARAHEPLLFPTPQRHANGAAWLRAGRFENSHGLDHRDAAGGVVGRAGGAVMRIEVRANPHHAIVMLHRDHDARQSFPGV